ncbi:MAG: hypothetical protein K2O24_08430 [Muribaculaceae bacterium]|nr:hypothetical protein [Muribaculaceae bacterium]
MAEVSENTGSPRKVSPFRLMCGILSGPVQGWKNVKRSGPELQDVLSRLFYPMTALASFSRFADLFYDANAVLSRIIVDCIVTFIAFFFSFFAIPVVAKWVLPVDSTAWADKPFGKQFVAYALSTLALFATLYTLLPMLEPVMVFLPLWTIYTICRGVRFLRVPEERETRVSIALSVMITGFPLLTGWLFYKILPS